MTEKFDYAKAHLEGAITAGNFIDECVSRNGGDDESLKTLIQKMSGDDEQSKARLAGFCNGLYCWMREQA